MKFYLASFCVAFFVLILLSNCKHQPIDLPIPKKNTTIDSNKNVNDSICFGDIINPILSSNCSSCHNDSIENSGVNLSTYSKLISTVSGSLLMQVIQDNGSLGMPFPPQPKLTAQQIALMQQWVNEGMKNGIDCGNCPTDTVNVTFSGTIFPVIQNNCLGCHNGVSSVLAGPNLSTYDSIKVQVVNGQLNCSLNHSGSCNPMPLNQSQLCSGVLAQIKKWINSGSPNN